MKFRIEINNKKKIKRLVVYEWIKKNEFIRFLRYAEKIMENSDTYKDVIDPELSSRYEVEVEFMEEENYYKFINIKRIGDKDYIPADTKDIVKEICLELDIDEGLVKEKNNKKEVVKIKAFTHLVVKMLTGQNYSELGRRLKTPHPTILHRIRKTLTSYLYPRDPEMMLWIDKCNKLYNINIGKELENI